MPIRRPALLLTALALVASACTGAGGPTTSVADPPATTAPGAGTTQAPATTSSPSTVANPALMAELERLQAITEEVRGLEFLEPPNVALVTREELARRVRELVEEELDPEQLEVDQALLILIGLIDPGTDLQELYLDLYAEQVAGFYDGDARELVVPAGDGFSPLTKVTLVHELVHALTDQHFEFNERYERLDDEERFDEASAYQALIEGDATLFQLVYLRDHVTREEQLEVAGEALEQESAVFDRTPRFLRELLLFPYDTGNTFVQALAQEGGIRAVDEAYRGPPATTEQVIHPQKYRQGEAALPVDLPAAPLQGYEVREESVWGELGFRVMLAQVLGSGEAAPAAAGWGGDAYRILWNGEDVAMALRYRGDTEGDAEALLRALRRYVRQGMGASDESSVGGGTAFGGGTGFAFLSRSGDTLNFVVASDPSAGEELQRAMAQE